MLSSSCPVGHPLEPRPNERAETLHRARDVIAVVEDLADRHTGLAARLQVEHSLVASGMLKEVDRSNGVLDPLLEACQDPATGAIRVDKWREVLSEDHRNPDQFRGLSVPNQPGGDQPMVGTKGSQQGRATALNALGLLDNTATEQRVREAERFHPGQGPYGRGNALNDHRQAGDDTGTNVITKNQGQNAAELAIWARDQLNAKCGHLKRAFKMFDEDGSGEVAVDELKTNLTRLGVLTPRDIDRLFTLADKDGDKKLNYAEFSSMLQDPYSRLEDLYGVTGGDGRPAGGEAKFKQPDIENPLADEVQS